MRAVVLCYHGINIHGNQHENNDHVALAQDLRLIHSLRLPIISLHTLVAALDDSTNNLGPCVALSFDDGSWFDWHDLNHPSCGPQRSFANILADFEQDTNQPAPATSFVIASPEARDILDHTCMIGKGWWGDEWWSPAIETGRLSIENHSWDHQHETLPSIASGLPGGMFSNVADHTSADIQIRQASAYLDMMLPQRRTRLFAYPYGETTDYLTSEYLPDFRHEHGLDAAFTTQPEPVTSHSSRWLLGRYVCGHHWKSTDTLHPLLKDALGVR
ncbi:MAG: polysaccharide deacetylase family protein [Lysobacteraceae bacterium]